MFFKLCAKSLSTPGLVCFLPFQAARQASYNGHCLVLSHGACQYLHSSFAVIDGDQWPGQTSNSISYSHADPPPANIKSQYGTSRTCHC